MGNKNIRIWWLNILVCLFAVNVYSQESATEGREFYFAFTENQYTDNLCQIRYAVMDSCYITAQYGDGTYIDDNVLYGPGIYTKTVNKARCQIRLAGVSNLGIKVTATKNISLYAINQQRVSTDATTVFPIGALSNEYAVISHMPSSRHSNILIIAPENGTVFSIKDPSGTVVVSNQTLSARQSYFYRVLMADLTGYTVESNYNIAVFSTGDCGVQDPDGGCDHNYEQMWPMHTAGRNFFLWNHSNSPLTTDQIVVLGLEDGTTVTKKEGNTTTTISLNKFQKRKFALQQENPYTNGSTAPVMLRSDKPIIVNHILGYAPSVKWWTSIEQNITSTVISPFIISAITNHWLHLMIPAGSEENMIIREHRDETITDVTLPFYTNTTSADYLIATKQYSATDEVLIELINPAGFMANMQGVGNSISYIFTAGAGAFDLQAYYTIQSQTSPFHDTYYAATERETHSFGTSDSITIKRTIEMPFHTITWLINDAPYIIAENTNVNNTLKFPASALVGGENTIRMAVRYNGTSADSVYTANVWRLSVEAKDDNFVVRQQVESSLDVLANDVNLCSPGDLVLTITQAPTNGTASVADGVVKYTPSADFIGQDSIYYRITCDGFESIAKMKINVVNFPDNIVDSSFCTIPFEPIVFDVKSKWYSAAATAHGQTGLLVGDVDGDGVPEIFSVGSTLTTLNVLDGSTGVLKHSMAIPVSSGYGGWHPVFTGVLVDSDGNGWGELIYAANDNTLTSYEATVTAGTFSMTQKWKTTFESPPTEAIAAQNNDNKPQPIVADFNGDGIPEVVVYNQIYNARTGALLGKTEANTTANFGRILNRGGNNRTNFMTAIDFDGDGLPEIAAGNKIYKVTLNAPGTVATCSILYQTTTFGDGFTSVADVDLDGNMDVVVIDVNSNLTRINVWSPRDNRVIDQMSIANSNTYQGYAFIGDIDGVVSSDGKRYPEICVTTIQVTPRAGRVSAYKYNPITKKYEHKWDLINTDTSGGTGITLFDFNNDGINELVYRDEQFLYILNGVADGIAPVLAHANAQITCTSGTAFEFPVIADIDGSGSAKICVTCAANSAAVGHAVNAFESATTPWSPTRKIWNQVNYEPTGINEDLTVPKSLFPKNYAFELGANTHWPYNGALIQVPIANIELNPVVNAADPYVKTVSTAFLHDSIVRVSVVIENSGELNTNPSLPVALYIESIAPVNLFEVKPVGVALSGGQQATLHYDIPVGEAKNQVFARIQDDGADYPALGSYTDCNYANNTGSGITVIATNDYVFVRKGETAEINFLVNDFLGTCSDASITLTVEAAPVNGSYTLTSDKKIRYTPLSADFEGNDSIRYKIRCGAVEDDAMIYIQVLERPDNVTDADCYVDPVAMEWSIQDVYSGGSYSTLQSPLVGDLDGDGNPEILVINTASDETGNRVYILNADGSEKGSIGIPTVKTGAFPLCGIARVQYTPNVYKGIIIISYATSDTYKLRAYDEAGIMLWESSEAVGPQTNNYVNMAISIVDLDGDGWAEIVVGDKVFAAENGQLLCKGSGVNIGYCKGLSAAYYLLQPIVAPVLQNGKPQICIGSSVYEATINDRNNASFNSFTLVRSIEPRLFDGTLIPSEDGATQVVDFDLDGHLDVVVSWIDLIAADIYVYVWSPVKQEMIASKKIGNMMKKGASFIGDIDGDGYPEIVFVHGVTNANSSHVNDGITALKYDPSSLTGELSTFWKINHSDKSCGTGITLFDFNLDGIFELVYRDESRLRIINGSGKSHITGNDTISSDQPVVYDLTTLASGSTTAFEYPVVADIDSDGQAEILTIGKSTYTVAGPLRIFKSGNSLYPWSPARKVWNQFSYNAVNVNNDLTIPRYQMSPATVFPGSDGVLGTPDDVRPYNAFLQQQTALNKNGTPLSLASDVFPDSTLTTTAVVGDSVCITVGIINQGDASVGSPVYVSLYKEFVSAANYMITDSAVIQIHPGDTGYVAVRIPDMTLYPVANVVIRVNDKDGNFPYQSECNSANNVITIVNPALHLFMKKDATLLLTPPVRHNGTLPNPIAVLFSEDIKYEITAVNVSSAPASILIRDTLPAYLKYNVGTENPTANFVKTVTTSGVPEREILTWTVPGVVAGASTKVSFEATPTDGSCASQPLYINNAWITLGSLQIPTGNSTYYQGAGVAMITFSAGLGGQIYHAEPQAVDYRTAARAGVLIVPDEGYRFDGWAHDEYASLRGDKIAARKGVLNYDTLTIFGNVALQANFELEEYPIRYHLNGGINAATNPTTYTIASNAIELTAPTKADDVFIGWTGSNGNTPQLSVVLPEGTTGALAFYANFRNSGREEEALEEEIVDDRIWAVKDELYIRTSKVGGLVHIYTMEGVLHKAHTITAVGETKLKLPRGLYIVTLDNGVGQKIIIE